MNNNPEIVKKKTYKETKDKYRKAHKEQIKQSHRVYYLKHRYGIDADLIKKFGVFADDVCKFVFHYRKVVTAIPELAPVLLSLLSEIELPENILPLIYEAEPQNIILGPSEDDMVL